jgi:hypothetical protein
MIDALQLFGVVGVFAASFGAVYHKMIGMQKDINNKMTGMQKDITKLSTKMNLVYNNLNVALEFKKK